MQHIEVYREKGRYCSWPVNYSSWSCGEEVVVGFALGHHA